jgi:hypothetical protein
VAARCFTYDLSWSGAIHINRRANPRRPPALPVRIIATRLSQTGVYSPIIQAAIRAQPAQPSPPPAQPTPLPAFTQQQLQWLEEDLHPEPRLPTLPSYHSHAMSEISDHPSIPALDLVLDHEDREENRTPTLNGPMPGVHLGMGWRRNLNDETGNPIFTEYLINGISRSLPPTSSSTWTLTPPNSSSPVADAVRSIPAPYEHARTPTPGQHSHANSATRSMLTNHFPA